MNLYLNVCCVFIYCGLAVSSSFVVLNSFLLQGRVVSNSGYVSSLLASSQNFVSNSFYLLTNGVCLNRNCLLIQCRGNIYMESLFHRYSVFILFTNRERVSPK